MYEDFFCNVIAVLKYPLTYKLRLRPTQNHYRKLQGKHDRKLFNINNNSRTFSEI